jgi:hypothetical protein
MGEGPGGHDHGVSREAESGTDERRDRPDPARSAIVLTLRDRDLAIVLTPRDRGSRIAISRSRDRPDPARRATAPNTMTGWICSGRQEWPVLAGREGSS